MYKTDFIDAKEDITKASKERLEELKNLKAFCIAIDNFVAFRPSFGYHTIIAGYPWFLD